MFPPSFERFMSLDSTGKQDDPGSVSAASLRPAYVDHVHIEIRPPGLRNAIHQHPGQLSGRLRADKTRGYPGKFLPATSPMPATSGSNNVSKVPGADMVARGAAVEACLGCDDALGVAAIRGAPSSGQLDSAIRGAIGKHPPESCCCRQRLACCTIVWLKNAGSQYGSGRRLGQMPKTNIDRIAPLCVENSSG